MTFNGEDLNDLPVIPRLKAKVYRALMVAFFYNDVRFRHYAEKLEGVIVAAGYADEDA